MNKRMIEEYFNYLSAIPVVGVSSSIGISVLGGYSIYANLIGLGLLQGLPDQFACPLPPLLFCSVLPNHKTPNIPDPDPGSLESCICASQS